MKSKIKIVTAFLMFTAFFSFAQTREDISIYIPMPIGGTSEQENYFLENFTMETTAAGYAVVDTQAKADYTLKLEIKPNMVMYDDGTEEQAPPDEPQNILELKLSRNNDNTEIVSFSFPFTDTSEMYDYNLYLLYQAMANVPLTKMTAVPDTDHWRNKWLYIRGSFDYTLIAYSANPNKTNKEWGPTDVSNNTLNYGMTNLDDRSKLQPRSSLGATVGLELQFLNWMSAEAYLKLLTNEIGGSSVVPAVGFEVKFPLKPAKIFMIEPYAVVEFITNTGADIRPEGAPIGLGGGAQFGVKGGEMGAFFVDINYIYNLTDIHIYKQDKMDAYFNRWALGFSVGYKLGFFNRNPD